MAQQEKGIKLRAWSLHAEDYVDEDAFRQAVATELAQLEHMGERFGVGFVVAPVREASPLGGYKTVRWIFQSETIPAAPLWSPDPISLGDENDGTGAEHELAGVAE
jgi:hypothetical protein